MTIKDENLKISIAVNNEASIMLLLTIVEEYPSAIVMARKGAETFQKSGF
ncbi:MAG: hypothetical protein Q8S41_11845 [Lutibacter sp.]|nr:hypothetical protein [Lutibacter sp.]